MIDVYINESRSSPSSTQNSGSTPMSMRSNYALERSVTALSLTPVTGCRGMIGLIIVLLSGCMTSFSSKMDSWVGNPITDRLEFPKAKIRELSGRDRQGNRVYLEDWDSDCEVYWTVNASGVITGWSSEGKACKYYVN
jgi:hypothetical protein